MTEQIKVKIILNNPIVFPLESIEQRKPIQRALIAFGEMADKYTFLGKKYINAKTLDEMPVKGHAWKTAIKVISYVLTAGLSFILASIAKGIYKDWASNHLPHELPVQSNSSPSKEQQAGEVPPPASQETNKQETNDSAKNLSRSSSDLSAESLNGLSVDLARKVLDELPNVEDVTEPSKKTPSVATQSALEGLSSDHKDCLIVGHLIALKTEKMSEVARIKHLFNLKEIADSGHQSQNSQIGKLLKEVLYPEPPKLNDLLSKLGTGQFFIERSPKAGIPEDFYNLGDFVEQMLKKILAQDKLIVGRIRDQLTPEQQRYISDLHNDGGIEPKEEPVKAKSGSGKFYVLRNITGKGVRDVSTKEASTPNPWKDSAKWKENSQTETRSMEEQKNSLKNAETLDFGTSNFGTS